MAQVTQKQAYKRYIAMFVPTMALYVVGLVGGSWIWTSYDAPPMWLSVSVLLAATVPLLGFLYIWLRYAREADEYQREKMLWAFAISGCLTAGVAFALGFAETFDLMGHIGAYWYAILFISLQGLVTALGGGKCLP